MQFPNDFMGTTKAEVQGRFLILIFINHQYLINTSLYSKWGYWLTSHFQNMYKHQGMQGLVHLLLLTIHVSM